MTQSNNPGLESSTNPYSIFQSDSPTTVDPEDKLDEILHSDNEQKLNISLMISLPKSGDSSPIRQFKDIFTKVSTALDELNTSKASDSNTTTFIKDIKSAYKHMLAAFDSTYEQISNHNKTVYNTHCNNYLNTSLHMYKHKLDDITTK